MNRESTPAESMADEQHPFDLLVKLRVGEDRLVVEAEREPFAFVYLEDWDPDNEGAGLGVTDRPAGESREWLFVKPSLKTERGMGFKLISHAFNPVPPNYLIPGFLDRARELWRSGQCGSLFLLVALATCLDRILPEGEAVRVYPIHKKLHTIREPAILVLLSEFYRRLAMVSPDQARPVDATGLQEHIVDLIRSALSWQPLPEGAARRIRGLIEIVENPISKSRLEQKIAETPIDTDWPRQLRLFERQGSKTLRRGM